jgi:thiamine-phosphate pyrophosphorylase
MAQHGAACRLIVVVEAHEAASAQLRAILDRTAVASVVIAPASTTKRLDATAARALIELAQSRGAAALLEGEPHLVRTLEADGVHMPWSPAVAEQLAAAREIIGGRLIAGADAGRSRDDAMTLGELGADYVAFSVRADVEDQSTAHARRLDLVQWWCEIFEVPAVALDVESADEAAALADAVCDFVAVRVDPEASAVAAADRVMAIASAVGSAAVNA